MLATDQWGAASHRNMASALAGPLRAGAGETAIAIDATGRAEVGWTSYEPVLLAAPRRSLGDAALRLEATLEPAGDVAPLTFAAGTEAGSFACLWRPVAEPFALVLRAVEVAADGTTTPVLAAERVELALLEGVLGRMALLLGAEKQRLRRITRDLAAMRTLGGARDDALDRLGADLQVPRFADRIRVRENAVVLEPGREADAEYRTRLHLYRPWLQPSRGGVADLLERPELRPPDARYALDDRGETFAVALKVLAAGTARTRFLDHVRLVHLILPANNPYANTVHARRFVPPARRESDTALRAALRHWFDFADPDTPNPALARPLATALVRAARCREALDPARPWPCPRTQDVKGGSRYELGLGADLQALDAATLQRLADRHADRGAADDPEIETLLRGMTPRAPAEDPDGEWLLGPCGLRTVHAVDETRVFVSHLPLHGLVIDGPASVQAGEPATFDARYHARLDGGTNAVLAAGLARASAAWTAGGRTPWTGLDDAAARTRWSAAPRLPANAPALGVLREAGLPAVADPALVVGRLKQVRPELLATILLPADVSRRIVAGERAAVTQLRELADILRAGWLNAVLPLVVGANEVALIAAVTRLPEAGTNLSRRRATGVRWYAEPVSGAGGALAGRVGPQISFTPDGPGVTVVMALGYARRGLTAPYEMRVTLPPGALLDFSRYELLMNAFDLAHPLGVGINTAEVRREHVDLDGDGHADPLSATLSRSYRVFRPRRIRVTGDVFNPETPGLQVAVHATIGVDTILAP